MCEAGKGWFDGVPCDGVDDVCEAGKGEAGDVPCVGVDGLGAVGGASVVVCKLPDDDAVRCGGGSFAKKTEANVSFETRRGTER